MTTFDNVERLLNINVSPGALAEPKVLKTTQLIESILSIVFERISSVDCEKLI
jgi:hypothetical protein